MKITIDYTLEEAVDLGILIEFCKQNNIEYSNGTVSKYEKPIKILNGKRKKKGPRMTKTISADIRKYHKNNPSVPKMEIAERYNYSLSTIDRAISQTTAADLK